jgi:uncharacterized glyoxalase superfamily protein PhnB
MQLGYIIIYVSDIRATIDFYQKALGLELKFLHESAMYAEMSTGNTVLAFAHLDMMDMHIGIKAAQGIKNCFEIAFTTEDVQQAYDKAILHGAIALAAPQEKPWGQTVSYIQDPFGTIIEICTSMKK